MTPGGTIRAIKPGDHLYLIDASGYIFRAYHALPPLTRKSDGLPTGAVAGFSNMLWKLLEETKAGDKPTHIAAIFDAGRKSFRNDLYTDYKANRAEPPDDLVPQFPLVRDATRAFGVPAIEMPGYEADDLIATYTRLAREAGARVTIVSSDKDLMQLVDDGVVELLDTMKGKRIGSAEVNERFGVPPEKVASVLALAGDTSDNVPGVPGIGVKTAAELIGQYGDIDTLLARTADIKQPKRRQTLIDNAENARLSLRLVILEDRVPVATPLSDFGCCDPDVRELVPFLKMMEFTTLLRRVATVLGIEDIEGFAAPAQALTPAAKPQPLAPMKQDGGCPGAVLDRAAYLKPVDYGAYETVTDAATLEKWATQIRETGIFALSIETDAREAMRATITGIALAPAPGMACYVPLSHQTLDAQAQMTQAEAFTALRPLFEDAATLKIGHDIKFMHLLLRRHGIALRAFDDVQLMSYVLDCGRNGHGLEELSELHLQHKPIALSDVTGKGRERQPFELAALDAATRYAAENADIALRLAALLKPRLISERRMTVYETLERALVPVLSDMEFEGICIAPAFLESLSAAFAQDMARLEKEICALAGEDFNIGSPKQLGDILFGKFSLPGGRRTKTGAWSTDADILEELAAQGHEIPVKVLEWRQLSKLKSTYTDSLPLHVNPATGRVHTNFALAATTTGRLSSIDPNLQNIPIRTEEGRRIRKAFIAREGHLLVSADYSQIELRLLAHIADVPALTKAFADGVDIHAMTASEMFGVPVAGMPAEIRRRAKAINFGIIYGISAFGLSNQLAIPRGEADAYIKKYFERFPGIRAYMDRMRAFVRETGYVDTIFGRRIHIRDIKAQSAALRAFAERQAINAPIQGSAADVIRRAMVKLPAALADAGLNAKLLLQVHDELVIEAPAAEADHVCRVARAVMEKAALPALALKVPLVVEARAGHNWDEAH